MDKLFPCDPYMFAIERCFYMHDGGLLVCMIDAMYTSIKLMSLIGRTENFEVQNRGTL